MSRSILCVAISREPMKECLLFPLLNVVFANCDGVANRPTKPGVPLRANNPART